MIEEVRIRVEPDGKSPEVLAAEFADFCMTLHSRPGKEAR